MPMTGAEARRHWWAEIVANLEASMDRPPRVGEVIDWAEATYRQQLEGDKRLPWRLAMWAMFNVRRGALISRRDVYDPGDGYAFVTRYEARYHPPLSADAQERRLATARRWLRESDPDVYEDRPFSRLMPA